MVFLEIISCWVQQFRNCDTSKFFENVSSKKEEKHSNSENIEDFSKVNRQNDIKIAKVSFKPFS